MKKSAPFTALLLIFAAGFGLCSSSLPDPLTRFLAKYMHFTGSELVAVGRGEVIAKPIDTDAKRELAFFGIVHVNGSTDDLVERFRDIETFKKGEAVLKVKKLSDPPFVMISMQ